MHFWLMVVAAFILVNDVIYSNIHFAKNRYASLGFGLMLSFAALGYALSFAFRALP